MDLLAKQQNESGPSVFAFTKDHCTARQLRSMTEPEPGDQPFAGPRCFICGQLITEGQEYYWLQVNRWQRRHTTCARKNAGRTREALTEDEKRQQLIAEGTIGPKNGHEGRVIRSPRGL